MREKPKDESRLLHMIEAIDNIKQELLPLKEQVENILKEL